MRVIVATVLVLATGALSTCDGSSVSPLIAMSLLAPTSKPTSAPTSTPVAEAVIVIAGADLDGLHVSASGYVAGAVATGGP